MLFCSPISERPLLGWKARSTRPLVLLMAVLRCVCCMNACSSRYKEAVAMLLVVWNRSCLRVAVGGYFRHDGAIAWTGLLPTLTHRCRWQCLANWRSSVRRSWESSTVLSSKRSRVRWWSDQVDDLCSFYQSLQMNTAVIFKNRPRHFYSNCSQTSQIISKTLCIVLPAQTVSGCQLSRDILYMYRL
jgi:hypothetical protein